MRHRVQTALTLAAALCFALLGGCAGGSAGAGARAAESAISAGRQPGYAAPPFADSVFHADAAAGENGALVDTLCTAQGYVAASAVSEKRLKFQINFGDIQYNYDLPNDGTPTIFPLQSGSGSYGLRVMQNTEDNKYIELYAVTAEVTLESEFAPFLRPSQIVHYAADDACVQLAGELAADSADDTALLASVYDYVVQHVTYDYDKAAAITSGSVTGYLPVPDDTLASGKGICYDYAALMAAMLRSQGVPTKLITGYVEDGSVYHAWDMVWLKNAGWVTVSFSVPANAWQRIDATFAAAGASASVGNGSDYIDRYTY